MHRRECTRLIRLQRYKLGHSIKFRKIIEVPQKLSLISNYNETIDFLRNVHNSVFNDGNNLLLNFSNCTEITPESCVIIAAEIDRCLRKRPRSINGNYPNNDAAYATLKALGFFRLLNIRSERPISVVPVDPDLQIVGLVSGKGKKESITEGILDLFVSMPKFQEGRQLFGFKVFRALTEAMGNVIEHAYPADYHDQYDCVRSWWRAGFRQSNKITVVLYDQGKGIPHTLPSTWPDALKAVAQGKLAPNDSTMIKYAMELNRSSASQQGRGKGLHDIKMLIDFIGAGQLHIFSYKGHYYYSPLDGENCKDESTTLPGTLIVWTVDAEGKK